jgi:hypothetical protein
VSRSIFHRRRRKIMALIPLKIRAGIAALTFAAVVAPGGELYSKRLCGLGAWRLP